MLLRALICVSSNANTCSALTLVQRDRGSLQEFCCHRGLVIGCDDGLGGRSSVISFIVASSALLLFEFVSAVVSAVGSK
jgi:hypothetical protein